MPTAGAGRRNRDASSHDDSAYTHGPIARGRSGAHGAETGRKIVEVRTSNNSSISSDMSRKTV